MREIPLTRGFVALVDDTDYTELVKHKWHVKPASNGATFYAVRHEVVGGKTKQLKMDRHLLCCPFGLVVDHKDGNGLNNKRENLRICTIAQNQKNLSPYSKNMASQFKGVSWDATHRKWRAEIHADKVRHKLGRFKTDVEAAIAYNKAAAILHGEFAKLNICTTEAP